MKINLSCLAVLSICVLSCSIKNGDEKLDIAKKQTEKYYKYYSLKQDDSMLNILHSTDTDKVLRFFDTLHRDYGDVVSKELFNVHKSSTFKNGKNELKIDISYKVVYSSGLTNKEIFNYVFNDSNSNKIYSMSYEKWEDEE